MPNYTLTQSGAQVQDILNRAILESTDGNAMLIPIGTTAQRPVSPATGYMRFNTDLLAVETYNGSTWITASGQMLGNSTVKAISFNSQVINENITVPANVNASMVGTVTIGDEYTLRIETGARVVVL